MGGPAPVLFLSDDHVRRAIVRPPRMISSRGLRVCCPGWIRRRCIRRGRIGLRLVVVGCGALLPSGRGFAAVQEERQLPGRRQSSIARRRQSALGRPGPFKATSAPRAKRGGLSRLRRPHGRRQCSSVEPQAPVSPARGQLGTAWDGQEAGQPCFRSRPSERALLQDCHRRCSQRLPSGQKLRQPSTGVQARCFPAMSARASLMTWSCGVAGVGSASASCTLARNQES